MTQSGEIYTFGPFRLEVAARTLAREGEAVTLTAKRSIRCSSCSRTATGSWKKRSWSSSCLARHVRVGRQPHAQRLGSAARARRRFGATGLYRRRFRVEGIGSPHRFTWSAVPFRRDAVVGERRRIRRRARIRRSSTHVGHSRSRPGARSPLVVCCTARFPLPATLALAVRFMPAAPVGRGARA